MMQPQSSNAVPWYLRKQVPYFLLIISCLLLYVQTCWYSFSPMDERWIIIAERAHLSKFSNLPDLFRFSTLGMYYRPMLAVSLMMDYLAGDGATFYFHLTNVLLHIICSLLLFRFFTLLQLSRATAFFAALIFVVHPVNIHAVAWIPGRNDSLLTMFTLLSCIFFLQFVQDQKWYRLFFHLLFFILALFTKESAIVLPAVFLLIYFLLAQQKKTSTLILLSIAWVLLDIAWYMLRMRLVNYLPPATPGPEGIIPGFFAALVIHTGKILLPVQQSVMPLLSNTSLWPYIAAIIFAGILYFRYGVKDKKLAWLGIAWFAVFIVLPAWYGSTNGSGEHYEHRDYTPLPGALLFLSQLNLPVSNKQARIIAFIIIGLFTVKSAFRIPVYASEFTYAKAGAAEAPMTPVFHELVGQLYLERNESKAAVEAYTRAIALDSGNSGFFSNRAKAYTRLSDFKHALADDDKALQLDSTSAETWIDRGMVRFALHDIAGAKNDLDKGESMGGIAPVDFRRALEAALNSGEQ